MKRSLCFLICILTCFLLVLSGCSESEAPDGYQNVATDNEAFCFYVPKSWVDNTPSGTASAYYSSDDYSNVSFTCMVIDPGEMDDLAEYKAISIEELGTVLPNFKVIENETADDALAEEVAPITIAGRETITFEYECTLSGQTYKYMQAVTMKDDFFYIFTYTSLAENYDSHLEEVNSIISYITFK
ncbi:MAG: DcrB-related protein [Clostridia bacterium]|nr:DcrB-related protein [Clostridia bacterium]